MLRRASRVLVLGLALIAAGCSASRGGNEAPARTPVSGDLLPLLHAENPQLAHTAMLIAQTGDAQVIAIAGNRLTAIAVWGTAEPSLDEDARMRLLSQVYAGMVALPTPEVVQHCRAVADHPGTAPWHRAMASAVKIAESEGAPQGVVNTPTPSAPIMTPPTSAVVVERPDGIPPTAGTSTQAR